MYLSIGQITAKTERSRKEEMDLQMWMLFKGENKNDKEAHSCQIDYLIHDTWPFLHAHFLVKAAYLLARGRIAKSFEPFA